MEDLKYAYTFFSDFVEDGTIVTVDKMGEDKTPYDFENEWDADLVCRLLNKIAGSDQFATMSISDNNYGARIILKEVNG